MPDTVREPTAPRLLVLSSGATPPLDAVRDAAESVWPGVSTAHEHVPLPPDPAGLLTTLGGPFTARCLAPVLGRLIDRERPDVVLSTHPAITRGLEHLRRQRGLAVPVESWSPGTDPHGCEPVLRRLARTRPAPGPRPLRAPDALFAHIDTGSVPQHVGTVLVFEPGPTLTAEHAATMLTAVPGVLGRIAPADLHRPARWVPSPRRETRSLVDTVTATDLDAAVDAFFSVPLRTHEEVGAARLVTGLPGGRRALLVKLHHALGDGMTVLQALLSDTDDASLSWATRPVIPVGPTAVATLRPGVRTLSRGLLGLAASGRSPSALTDGPVSDPARHHARALLVGRQVRSGARALGVTPTVLLLTAFAHAWHDVARKHGGDSGAGDGDRVRLMVPWSQRGTDSLRAAGNHTGAVSLDLPVGPAEFADRARTVATALEKRTQSGVAEAAALVVQGLGTLPPLLHRAAARAAYSGAWFNAVGTVMPGPRRDVHWHGALMSAAYPVLPLAPGTGLAWGALTWRQWITVCVTTTTPLAEFGRALTERLGDLVAGAAA